MCLRIKKGKQDFKMRKSQEVQNLLSKDNLVTHCGHNQTVTY